MKSFFSNSLIISGLLLVSKVLGFIRDLLLAAFFGSSGALQAFLVAFRTPEFMRKVTTSGTFTQIINPYIDGKISNEQKEFIATILYLIAIVLMVLTITGLAFSDIWVDIYAYGLVSNDVMLQLVHTMFIIMLPYVLLNCIVGLIAAILNSYSKYIISSAFPVFLNLVMIIGVMISPRFSVPIYVVAYSVLLAGLCQLIVAVFSLSMLLGRINITKAIFFVRNVKAKIFFKKLPMTFLGAAVLQISSFIETFFASFLLSGSLAWLYYADRVNQFLYGIFGTAIAMAMIPYLVKTKKDNELFYKNLALAIKIMFVMIIPAIIGLIVLAKPIIITLFYYGKFSLNDVDFTYLAMLGYLISLFCFVFIRVIVSALYVQNRANTVFWISLSSLICGIVLDTYIIHAYSDDKYAFVYLAIVSSVTALVNMIAQILILISFNLKLFVKIFLPVKYLLKIVIACICMIVILKLFNLNDDYWISLSIFGRLRSILVIMSLSILVYISVIFVLRLRKMLVLDN
ncbi:murein biosynthesis integral membrane protein MurJ [Allofrancisella guangzhouensis]|uniref:Probable lipid II flippase MurJ n=1 Tax=Allofrancisella guangzhouensis TaxID=594679 RepID=A0A0A8E4V9_9GAMM|nr:murein biosynthesis integral membrane protein MurJ [Allofrancisella guangzhouensis]AJC48597.1 multidrug transporter [Allofrancisella guangzhouensis]MBK2027736.1 murein biosynthesis integral membrane protein MurJ [Allofrancisella guangzhouensis]MBK2043474.1 murein biosynthesis integral membrane protein MurJ [Allofrancisella guangzhouensis]MBK2045823.1 murein biosynthesis integral membrane protein MurJ [Allofrancisella guangzhouensis]